MDKITTPSIAPISLKFDVCKFDRSRLDYYSIVIDSSTKTYNGIDGPPYYFVPRYNPAAADPNMTLTRFLISADNFNNDVKIEQWKLDFGDRTTISGSIGPSSTLITSSISSGTTPSVGSPLTVNLADGSQFPNSGTILIDSEYFYYNSKSGNNLNVVARALAGTTAANHTIASSTTIAAQIKSVREVLHQYLYSGGANSNACLNASLVAMDTRGRRAATRQMVYPKDYA